MTTNEIPQLIAVMQRLLPGGMQLAGGKISAQPPTIHQEEWQIVEHAGKKRQREFASGRHYAHQLLQKMGCGQRIIGRDEHGIPLWPGGLSGSISHTDDYCTVLLTRRDEFASVGIDLEASSRLKRSLWSRLLTENEITDLQAIEDITEQTCRAATLFSAREAFYKCDYPLHHEHIPLARVEFAIQHDHILGLQLNGLHRDRNYAGYHISGMTHVLTTVFTG